MVATMGKLTCIDAKTGKSVFNHDYQKWFFSSPIYAAGKIYLTDIAGKTTIIDGGRTYKEISTPSVGEEVKATLAFVGKRIYIRGKHNIFCIEEK
jgi:outer membrane protein assembly factor BamB